VPTRDTWPYKGRAGADPEGGAGTRRAIWSTRPPRALCARRDSDPHDLAATDPSSLRVYQFRHERVRAPDPDRTGACRLRDGRSYRLSYKGMAAGQRLELRLTAPEAAVLPLDDPALNRLINWLYLHARVAPLGRRIVTHVKGLVDSERGSLPSSAGGGCRTRTRTCTRFELAISAVFGSRPLCALPGT
jgi:hypothetical protein